jgi:hypothetical protein
MIINIAAEACVQPSYHVQPQPNDWPDGQQSANVPT